MSGMRTPVTWIFTFVAVCCAVIAAATTGSFLLDRSRKTDEAKQIDLLQIEYQSLKAKLESIEKTAPSYKWMDEHGYIKVLPPLKKIVQ